MRRRSSERAFDEEVAKWLKELRQKSRISIYRLPAEIPRDRTPIVFQAAPSPSPSSVSGSVSDADPHSLIRLTPGHRRHGRMPVIIRYAGPASDAFQPLARCLARLRVSRLGDSGRRRAHARRRAPPGRRAAAGGDGPVSHARLPDALRPEARPGGRGRAARRRRRVRRGAPGRAGPLRLGGGLRSLRERGPRRVRHDRVGGRSAVVDRGDRDFRSVVPRRRAVARGGGIPAALEGDGARDDVLVAPQLLLCGRRLGPLLDRLDLGQHRARHARASKPSRPPVGEGGTGRPRSLPSAPDLAASADRTCRSPGRGALLLRVAGAPAGGAVLGLVRHPRASTEGSRPRS